MYKFAVIGNPISHSQSPAIHLKFAKAQGIEISYEKILSPLDKFTDTVEHFRSSGGYGANVTIPFKTQAAKYADQLTDRARLSESVNTLTFKNGICIGDNTDGIGLIRDLKNHEIDLKNKKILILGAGGAAQGIIPTLKLEKPAKIVILNRTSDKAIYLAKKYDCEIYSADKNNFDMVINTTSADFQKQTNIFNQIDFLENTIFYDLNYGERHNTFAKWVVDKNGIICIDGYGMLIEQAAESFFQWTGLKPKN